VSIANKESAVEFSLMCGEPPAAPGSTFMKPKYQGTWLHIDALSAIRRPFPGPSSQGSQASWRAIAAKNSDAAAPPAFTPWNHSPPSESRPSVRQHVEKDIFTFYVCTLDYVVLFRQESFLLCAEWGRGLVVGNKKFRQKRKRTTDVRLHGHGRATDDTVLLLLLWCSFSAHLVSSACGHSACGHSACGHEIRGRLRSSTERRRKW